MQTDRYSAFISYSKTDTQIAKDLQSFLEAFKIPADFDVAPPFVAGKKLPRCFRDDDELPASSNLGAALEAALERSEWLILIASPAAAASQWVNQEVVHFRSLGRADRILALLVDGEPLAQSRGLPAEREALPPAAHDSEPFWIDLRKEGKRRAFTKILAGVLSVDSDRLLQRERRRRRNRLVNGALATAGVALIMFALFQNQQRSADAKLLAEQATKELFAVDQLHQAAEGHEAARRLVAWVDRLNAADPSILGQSGALRVGFERQIDRVIRHTPRVEWRLTDARTSLAGLERAQGPLGLAPTAEEKLQREVERLNQMRTHPHLTLGVEAPHAQMSETRTPDGRYHASTRDGVRVFDADTNATLYQDGQSRGDVAISHDGRTLLVCNGYATRKRACDVIDIPSGAMRQRFSTDPKFSVPHGSLGVGVRNSVAVFPFMDMKGARPYPIIGLRSLDGIRSSWEFFVPPPDVKALATDHVDAAQVRISPSGDQIAIMAPGVFYILERVDGAWRKSIVTGAFAETPQPKCCNNMPSFAVDFARRIIVFGSIAYPVSIIQWETPSTASSSLGAFRRLRVRDRADLEICLSNCRVVGMLEDDAVFVVQDLETLITYAYRVSGELTPFSFQSNGAMLARFKAEVVGLDDDGRFVRGLRDGKSARFFLDDLIDRATDGRTRPASFDEKVEKLRSLASTIDQREQR